MQVSIHVDCDCGYKVFYKVGLAKDYRKEVQNHVLVDKSLDGFFQRQFGKEDVECPVFLVGFCDITQIL